MAVYRGDKKGEMAIRLIGLVGESVNSLPENRIGGRKWEGFLIHRFSLCTIQIEGLIMQNGRMTIQSHGSAFQF
jgi:hypothetical protein